MYSRIRLCLSFLFCGEREHAKKDLSVLLLNLDTAPQNSTVRKLLHLCQCERLWSLGALEFMSFLCDDSLLSSECIKFLRNVLVTAVVLLALLRIKVEDQDRLFCFVLFPCSLFAAWAFAVVLKRICHVMRFRKLLTCIASPMAESDTRSSVI